TGGLPESDRERRDHDNPAQRQSLPPRIGYTDAHRLGDGTEPRIFSICNPIASRRRSLPAGPSISTPTGKPSTVMPIGMLSPAMPALLMGRVLATNTSRVDIFLPFSVTSVEFSIGCAGIGVVGKISASILPPENACAYSC